MPEATDILHQRWHRQDKGVKVKHERGEDTGQGQRQTASGRDMGRARAREQVNGDDG